MDFAEHLMAYEVRRTDKTEVWTYFKLPWHGVLNIVMLGDMHYVAEKDTTNVELV